MAILRSGILGNVRGKVAGVVGSQWKDVNYVREYVKPANPQSAAQVVQRNLMAGTVEFAKQMVGQIFNPYTDRFQKSMSGFNFFIKRNIAEFVASPDYEDIKLTEGKLSPVANFASTYNTSTGEVALTWDENLGSNGLAGDKIFFGAYDTAGKIAYFAPAENTRDEEATTMTIPTGLTAGFVCTYLFAIKYVSSVVVLISNSGADYCAAP